MWNKENIINKTNLHNKYVNLMIRKITDYLDDPTQKQRKEKQLCKYCTYIEDTNENYSINTVWVISCMNCNKKIEFKNQEKNMFCSDCANKLNICIKCGVELD